MAANPELAASIKKHASNDGCENNWEEWYADSIGNVALIEYAVSEEGDFMVYLGRLITDTQVIESQDTKQEIVITDPNEIEAAMGRVVEDLISITKNTHPITKIPPATWAVFNFDMELTEQSLSEAYVRILTEWMPISAYKRDESVPHMEQYKTNKDNTWEIWLPVLNK